MTRGIVLPWLIRTVIPERTTDVVKDGVKRPLARAIPTVRVANVGASTVANRARPTDPAKTRKVPPAAVRAVIPAIVVSAVGRMHARNVANAMTPVLPSAGPRRGTAAVPGRIVPHERVRGDHSAMTIVPRAAGTAAEVVPNAAVDVGTPMTSAGGAVVPQGNAGNPV